tara:strand:- start:206 stop:637 length:432 start_codon:yes stop_codon:yes gene_type:complete
MKKLAIRFASLKKKLSERERQVKDLKEKIKTVEETLREKMVKAGFRNLALANGGGTIFLRSDLKAHAAKDVKALEIIQALKSNQMEDMAYETYSVGKLKSWIRDEIERRAEDGELVVDPSDALPSDLKNLLDAYMEVSVGFNK